MTLKSFFLAALTCAAVVASPAVAMDEGEAPFSPAMALVYALEQHSPAGAEQALRKGASANAKLGDGLTPLLKVVQDRIRYRSHKLQENCLKIAEILLDNGAGLEASREPEMNPVYLVFAALDEEMWRLFAKKRGLGELLRLVDWTEGEPVPLAADGKAVVVKTPAGYAAYRGKALFKTALRLSALDEDSASRMLILVPASDGDPDRAGRNGFLAFALNPSISEENRKSARLLPKYILNRTYSWKFDGSIYEAGFPIGPKPWLGERESGENDYGRRLLILSRGRLQDGAHFLLLSYSVWPEEIGEAEMQSKSNEMLGWDIMLRAAEK